MSKIKFLCPVCQTERILETTGRLGFIDHIRMMMLVAPLCALGFLIDGWVLAVKLSPSYFIIWGIWELVRGAQAKSQTLCPHCNFDVYLYLRDIKGARAKVETKLRGISDEIKAKIAAKKSEHQKKSGVVEALKEEEKVAEKTV